MVKDTIERIADDFYRQGFSVCDDFVFPEEAARLLKSLKEKSETFQKAGIGSGNSLLVDKSVRGDFIRWIEKEDALFHDLYIDRLWPIIELFNQRFFLGIVANEHHMAHYPRGAHYEKHVDTFRNSDARVVSTVLYLNHDWKAADGGELVIYPENGNTVKIEPLLGRLVLFESTLPHEVLLSNSDRYSITGWFKRRTAF
jgi:SM-20-related protein